GDHRVGILVALANAAALVVIALLILWEAAQRLLHPAPVHSGLMIGVALTALLLNTVISLWLHGEAKHDLNVRSAYLHMAGDAVSALGVVVAGLVGAVTGGTAADPGVSVPIGGAVLRGLWGVPARAVGEVREGR